MYACLCLCVEHVEALCVLCVRVFVSVSVCTNVSASESGEKKKEVSLPFCVHLWSLRV